MSNYRLTITKTGVHLSNPLNLSLKRWWWRLDRKDGTIGYSDNGYTYTKLGAYLCAKRRLHRQNRPVKQMEYDL